MEGVRKCIGGVGGGKGRCVGGVGSVLGCGKVWGGVGMGVGVWKCVWGVAKCVWDVGKGAERVLGWGVGANVGRNMGQSGRPGKCGEKGSVTILAPNSPYPNPPDHNSPDP